MKRNAIFFLIVSLALTATAQSLKTLKGTYVYTVQEDKNITFAEARHNAIQNAKFEALKEAFGVNMSTETSMLTDLKNGVSEEAMSELTAESLKGEWIVDNTQPNVDIMYDKDQRQFSYIVSVNGQARERLSYKTDFDCAVLIGGKEKSFEANTVVGKKRMYVSFESPVDGYLTIYMGETNGAMNCLLPYRNSGIGVYPIKAGVKYLFFDQTADHSATPIALSTKKGVEIDVMYVIFSTTSFSKCLDDKTDSNHPNQVSYEAFQKWLMQNKNHDKGMEEIHKWIKIVQE